MSDPYEENKKWWNIGELVIHSADAKRMDMLMVVIGYRHDLDEIKTCYVKEGKTIWLNDRKYLLDPKKFGLPTTVNELHGVRKCIAALSSRGRECNEHGFNTSHETNSYTYCLGCRYLEIEVQP